MFFGGLIFPKLSDLYGRQNMVAICAFILFLSGTATCFVTNLYSLLICSIFSGVGITGSVISITLFEEFVPNNIRGKLMVFQQQFWAAGSIFSVLFAWIILPQMDDDFGWRVYVGVATIPAWTLAIFSVFLPESIRWNCTVGEFDEAEKSIHKMLVANGKEPMEGRLVRSEIVTLRGRVRDMFVPKYRKASFLLIITFMLSMQCYYSIVFISERLF